MVALASVPALLLRRSVLASMPRRLRRGRPGRTSGRTASHRAARSRNDGRTFSSLSGIGASVVRVLVLCQPRIDVKPLVTSAPKCTRKVNGFCALLPSLAPNLTVQEEDTAQFAEQLVDDEKTRVREKLLRRLLEAREAETGPKRRFVGFEDETKAEREVLTELKAEGAIDESTKSSVRFTDAGYRKYAPIVKAFRRIGP